MTVTISGLQFRFRIVPVSLAAMQADGHGK